jgi:MAF protein
MAPTLRTHLPIVLASSSPYRRMLLERLQIPFTFASPEVDETPNDNESPLNLVTRLAKAKAEALKARSPGALIIGSDQAAVCEGVRFGKPGTPEKAIEQLQCLNGRRVDFLTGLALLNTETGRLQVDCVPYSVYFRRLTQAQIEGYVGLERPLDCAGSFKSEGLGIALFSKMEGEDPTSLIGLPLIRLAEMLRAEGVDVLTEAREVAS